MSRPTEYTPEEDALIARMVEAGEPMKAILAQMPHRTEQSVWARLKRLRYYGIVGRRPERARPSTTPKHHPEWPPERIEQLRALWAEGLSTAEIGRRMGCGKNAIVGKAHRLFLPPRPSPIKRSAEPKASAVLRARVTLPPLPSVHPAVVRAEKQNYVARIKAKMAGGAIGAIASVDEFTGDDRLAITVMVRQVAKAAAPPPPRGACCWLYGERGAYRQCEAVAVRGSYCADHGRRAYQPSQTNKETSHAF